MVNTLHYISSLNIYFVITEIWLFLFKKSFPNINVSLNESENFSLVDWRQRFLVSFQFIRGFNSLFDNQLYSWKRRTDSQL